MVKTLTNRRETKMKKIELCFVAVILMAVALLFSGCEEELAQKPDLRNELPQLSEITQNTNWIAKYGDGFESHQTANIALALHIINNQGEAIKQLNERLVKLEDPNLLTDPNK